MDNHFVYFMETGEFVKIGITKNINSRIKQVQTGTPMKIHKVAYIVVGSRDEALRLESELHKSVAKYKTFGEWFFESPDFYKKLHNALKKNGYQDWIKNKSYVHLGEQENEISKQLFLQIEELPLIEKDIFKQLSKLQALDVAIRQRKDNSFLVYSKEHLLLKISTRIKKLLKYTKKHQIHTGEYNDKKGKTTIEIDDENRKRRLKRALKNPLLKDFTPLLKKEIAKSDSGEKL